MPHVSSKKTILVGPVYPYRAGIAYCTTRLAEELQCEVISFKRQFPKFLYPGGDDVDPTLPSANARFLLDIVNPITWIRTALMLRREKPDAVILVWWIWVWALPYLVLIRALSRHTKVILQCHNIADKEPARWKSILTNRVLRRGDVLVVHAESELVQAVKRAGGRRIVTAQLPVHELGREIPTRHDAKSHLAVHGLNVALFFGHVRPFKGLDIALRAWTKLKTDVVLLVAGEAWFESEKEYRELAKGMHNVRFDFRFIPDSEIATWFAAADVVIAPYRTEAQSGVALTAFHFARPVIATRVGGLPQIIRNGVNGLLIAPEDPDALAAAVDAFFTGSDRPAMERAATESAKRNSWEDYGNRFSRLVLEP